LIKHAKFPITLTTARQNEKMKLWITTILLATAFSARATTLSLDNNLAYQLTESLTVEVGARLAGSEADARAASWDMIKSGQNPSLCSTGSVAMPA
jgi:hypothetical protein